MKEKILTLRSEGKSYKEIQDILNCSRGLISYHCGEGQKKKSLYRQRKRREDNVLIRKTENFKGKRGLQRKRIMFARKGLVGIPSFTVEDVMKRIGDSPICYLTGKLINLEDSKSFEFDHIIPPTKGGDNSLDNLGVTRKEINRMKQDMTINELIQACKEVLEHNGYKVTKKLKLLTS